MAALTLAAALYRCLFLLLVPRVLDTADAVHYAESAARLAAGDFFGYNPKIPLLYPLFGALANICFNDIESACRAVSLLFSTLTVIPVYALARDLHGRGAARMAGLVVAVWPWLADYACSVTTEATAVFFWFLGVWALSRAVRRGGAWIALAAGALFALHLTRPEGTVILIAAPVAALLCCSGIPRRTIIRRLGAYAAACAVLLGLHMLYTRGLTGQATVNYRAGFIVEEFDILRFVQTAVESSHNVLPIMLGPVLLLFLGAGFFMQRAPGRDTRLELYVLALAATQWAAGVFVLSPAPRYLMAPIIALAIWAAAGMALVAQRAAETPKWGRYLRALPVIALLGTMSLGAAITLGSEHLGRPPRQPREYKAAGLWMREHLAPGLVFTRKPQVAYYAGMASTGPDDADSLEQAIARARDARARYMVVDERYAPPGIRPLLDPARAPAGIVHLQTFDLYPQCRVVVYELAEAGS